MRKCSVYRLEADIYQRVVLSAPVLEAETTNLVVKRGDLNDIAQSCQNDVSNKCDEISMVSSSTWSTS